MSKWNTLSMKDKANYIALGVKSGITNLDTIRSVYNSYAQGGDIEEGNEGRPHIYEIDNNSEGCGEGYLDGMNAVFPLRTIKSTENKHKFGEGGAQDKVISTGNDYADAAVSFVPIVGSAMDIEDAYNDPSLANIGFAAVSTIADVLNLTGFGSVAGVPLKGLVRGAKAARAARKAKAITTLNKVGRAVTSSHATRELIRKATKARMGIRSTSTGTRTVGLKGRIPSINDLTEGLKETTVGDWLWFGTHVLEPEINAGQQVHNLMERNQNKK